MRSHYPNLRTGLQVVLLALAACSQQPRLPPLAADATVLAFGDSITAGNGAPAQASYPARLAPMIERRVVNAGVPGETTAEGRRRLPAALARHDPELVLLCLGGNDLLQRVPADRIRANLAAMLATLRQQRIPVVLIAVPEFSVLGGAHPLYAALGERFGVPVLSGTLNDILRDPSLKADPIHPNAEGYLRLAAAIASLLRERGALDPEA